MSIMNRNFWKRERRPRQQTGSTGLARQSANPYEGPERLFEEFFNNFGLAPFAPFEMAWGEFSPRVDVIETEKELQIKAELPGMSEKDIQVSLSRDTLTLSGEKKAEEEQRSGNIYRMERTYGSFSRTIALPVNVDTENAEATFKNGVLTINLPKVVAAKDSRKIKVKTE
ncbi:MAG: Hsp20/alpha crystallin family protein [Anaerolineae bacterium]|nr:Hsp20/alpha crystallin family protein [Anaerolineae bacterium]